ncbi:MAG: RNA-binding S4 domain-containing protein, partial [Pseudomonadales bacterium]|nr:RNA-binding S4 domain-containing protein [Pseudomonadales bacterium]MDP4764914.1 RNA-binding S4 domain-containing protein [Pseudomonadales bacterium]MDP4912652.1 RNA-binding S4 domain-containing protein [Pseudomonadales bacterium]
TYRTYNLQNIKSVSRTHRETVTKEHNINNTRVVEITRQPIELFKILKFEGLVNSGGQAKLVIADGQVLLNGSVETQKSKKIVSGDVITFMDNTLQILLKVPLAKEGV